MNTIVVPVDWLFAVAGMLLAGFIFWIKWEIMRYERRLEAVRDDLKIEVRRLHDRIDHIIELINGKE